MTKENDLVSWDDLYNFAKSQVENPLHPPLTEELIEGIFSDLEKWPLPVEIEDTFECGFSVARDLIRGVLLVSSVTQHTPTTS